MGHGQCLMQPVQYNEKYNYTYNLEINSSSSTIYAPLINY